MLSFDKRTMEQRLNKVKANWPDLIGCGITFMAFMAFIILVAAMFN